MVYQPRSDCKLTNALALCVQYNVVPTLATRLFLWQVFTISPIIIDNFNFFFCIYRETWTIIRSWSKFPRYIRSHNNSIVSKSNEWLPKPSLWKLSVQRSSITCCARYNNNTNGCSYRIWVNNYSYFEFTLRSGCLCSYSWLCL